MSHVLTDFLNAHLGRSWELEPVRSGEVNECWKVITPTANYFLKHQGNAAHNSINRVEEARLQRALCVSHLSPELVAHTLDYAWVLMHWVEAPTLATVCMEQQIPLFAQTLARIHQQAPDLPRWSMRDRINNYLTAVQQYQPEASLHLSERLAPYRYLLEAWDLGRRTFCHNDLSAHHILLSEPVQVVDWEYAGYGHPWFDVASTVSINSLTAAQEKELCAHYSIESGEQLSAADLAPWRELLQVINDLWFCAQRVQTD